MSVKADIKVFRTIGPHSPLCYAISIHLFLVGFRIYLALRIIYIHHTLKKFVQTQGLFCPLKGTACSGNEETYEDTRIEQ